MRSLHTLWEGALRAPHRRLRLRFAKGVSPSQLSRIQARHLSLRSPMMAANYDQWTKKKLIQQVKLLEAELSRHGAVPSIEQLDSTPSHATSQVPTAEDAQDVRGDDPTAPPKTQPKKKKTADPSKYSTRMIALKLAYLGKNYNGLEYNITGAEASIEEELWKALVKSYLIFPETPDEVNFAPWQYSKCGRTDKGVSAFGQVVTIRVRSNRPKPREAPEAAPEPEGDVKMVNSGEQPLDQAAPEESSEVETQKPEWDPVKDEIDYAKALNRVLPPDIRVLAWCGDLPPEFDARFSCRERRYRYFFTQPAFSPVPSEVNYPKGSATFRDGWLDIEAMRKAAKMFEGLHDFRNFCKIDATKQISNFWRRVFECDIVEVDGAGSALPFLEGSNYRPDTTVDGGHPKVYYFHVRGSAFLWHQIRHMVAVIFAVGQGLEKPSIVSHLLDVEQQPRRPTYNMANDVPLVLWDCIFPDISAEPERDMHNDSVPHNHHEDAVDWVWVGEDSPSHLHGVGGLAYQLWEQWRARKIDEILAGRLLEAVVSRPDLSRRRNGPEKLKQSDKIFEGGNTGRPCGVYRPILRRPLMLTPEEVNDRFAQDKGFINSAEMKKVKNWRSVYKAAKKGVTIPMEMEETLEDSKTSNPG